MAGASQPKGGSSTITARVPIPELTRPVCLPPLDHPQSTAVPRLMTPLPSPGLLGEGLEVSGEFGPRTDASITGRKVTVDGEVVLAAKGEKDALIIWYLAHLRILSLSYKR